MCNRQVAPTAAGAVAESTRRQPRGRVADHAGNLTDDGVLLYTYDAWNRLVAARRRVDAQTPVAAYEYDGLNRRIRRQVDNSGVGVVPGSDAGGIDGIQAGNLNEHYYYAGWRVIEERDDSANTLAQTVYGTEYIDAPVCRDRNTDVTAGGSPDDDCLDSGGSARYFYHQDANFRVVAMTDESAAVVERYDYDAYGEPRVYAGVSGAAESGALRMASAIGNPYLHQGLRWEGETGLHENRYRMLHSRLGRFMQRDPLGYRGGLNKYLDRDSAGLLDPFGLIPSDLEGQLWSKSCGQLDKLRKTQTDAGKAADAQEVFLARAEAREEAARADYARKAAEVNAARKRASMFLQKANDLLALWLKEGVDLRDYSAGLEIAYGKAALYTGAAAEGFSLGSAAFWSGTASVACSLAGTLLGGVSIVVSRQVEYHQTHGKLERDRAIRDYAFYNTQAAFTQRDYEDLLPGLRSAEAYLDGRRAYVDALRERIAKLRKEDERIRDIILKVYTRKCEYGWSRSKSDNFDRAREIERGDPQSPYP